jgi:mRNA interferase RelE/StbE
MKEIAYSKEAQTALARMPVNEAKRIRGKIEQYAADPASQRNNVKRLKGSRYFRLRVGDWRVIFDNQGRVLVILKIGPRGSVYD